MITNYTFWLKTGAVFQLLTAAFHSVTFFIVQPQPGNDTERQLLDLMSTYKMDLGAGFERSMKDLMDSFSISFTLLLLFGGLLNFFLLRKKVEPETVRGVIGINVLIFGSCFVAMVLLTFLPPIICTGLIFTSLLMAYLTVPKKNVAID